VIVADRLAVSINSLLKKCLNRHHYHHRALGATLSDLGLIDAADIS